jgi:hypothetical protein
MYQRSPTARDQYSDGGRWLQGNIRTFSPFWKASVQMEQLSDSRFDVSWRSSRTPFLMLWVRGPGTSSCSLSSSRYPPCGDSWRTLVSLLGVVIIGARLQNLVTGFALHFRRSKLYLTTGMVCRIRLLVSFLSFASRRRWCSAALIGTFGRNRCVRYPTQTIRSTMPTVIPIDPTTPISELFWVGGTEVGAMADSKNRIFKQMWGAREPTRWNRRENKLTKSRELFFLFKNVILSTASAHLHLRRL